MGRSKKHAPSQDRLIKDEAIAYLISRNGFCGEDDLILHVQSKLQVPQFLIRTSLGRLERKGKVGLVNRVAMLFDTPPANRR